MSQGFVAVQRYKDGVPTSLKQRYHSNTVTGSNEITVRAYGNRMSVIVNGERELRLVDPTPLRYGGVEVGEIWETNGCFDNVRVWQRVS